MRVVVRLRTRPEGRVVPGHRPNRPLARAAFGLLEALALNSFVLCGWRWLFDLEIVGRFPFADGVFARWQVWFAAAVVCQLLASALARYAHRPVHRNRTARVNRDRPKRRRRCLVPGPAPARRSVFSRS